MNMTRTIKLLLFGVCACFALVFSAAYAMPLPPATSSGAAQAGDYAVPGDYDGDGQADLMWFRPATSEWFLIPSASVTCVPPGCTPGSYQQVSYWGGGSDIPVAGDYDGDGKADIAIFRPSTGEWWIRYSTGSGVQPIVFGIPGDVPVPADYNGDRKTDVAVWRPSAGTVYIR